MKSRWCEKGCSRDTCESRPWRMGLASAADFERLVALLGHSRLDTVRVYAQPDLQALDGKVLTPIRPLDEVYCLG